MQKTIQTLIEFMPGKVQFIGSKEESMCEDINYEIYEQETEELVGVCTLDETGLLKEYHCVNHYEDGNIKRKEVPAIAETFIRTFYPDGLNTYKLQSVIDLDDAYVLHYGIEDEKYGIDIPHIGISISVATTGHVVQFTIDNDPYDIIYPKHILSAEEAKERYLSNLDFELIICNADDEIYENGDNDYHLVYRILESAMDIPANGDEPSTIEESNEMKQINERVVPNQTVYEMIGITKEYRKIGEQTVEQEKIEIWAHESVGIPAEIDYEEEFLESFIRVVFHKKDDMLLFVHHGETMKIKVDMEQLSKQELKQCALDFIFTLYPKAHEQFYLELSEVEEAYEDDDYLDDEGEEDTEDFYFHRIVNGIVVDEKVICVSVGKYTGKLKGLFGDLVKWEEIEHLSVHPQITKEEAKQLYAKDLVMELAFSLEYEEDDSRKMNLTYLPSFPQTTGHIQMIEALTGEAYFVDVGDSKFF